ncbi:mannose-1-phosphate guanylyltransferase [Halocatena pleomorpha]|uniref:Mannose-1-phosphate guanylyltransferase n=1 Tax=Halocatena pleomorpha TaxID=1785090 RepID=A0A3P3RCE3_9EURY|nr:sugar phosphate nucleotidyltransferase [Halocatena pleomorpha]RRJ31147.1 mannose-1-phosphate guanylyltransferase [Halocatena pleomorpha]
MQIAVVLAGGVGTRMYPASSDECPKQFLSFGEDGMSLLSRTVQRVENAVDAVYVLTRPEYADRISEHAPDATVLTEPQGKDTGPALVYAAHRLRDVGSDPVLLCVPSDHYVGHSFASISQRAMNVAQETNELVTLGIEPTRAATGYGYINPDEKRGDHFTVDGFHEKPDPETASQYIYDGFYWNAGVFSWTPEALLDAARDTELRPLVEALQSGNEQEGFDAVESVSIDHAVLESTDGLRMVTADVPWDDLGSWDALRRVCDTDENGTVALGDVLTIDTDDCVIAAGDESQISAVGVSELTIAAYDGRVLVVPTDETQRVRDVVDERSER